MFPVPTLSGPFDAVALRGARRGRACDFGLYDSDGDVVPFGDVSGGFMRAAPAGMAEAPAVVGVDDGPVLFAGLAPPQFGHVILNSLGRLWALDRLSAETRLLYLPWRRPNPDHYPHLVPLLDLLGICSRPLLLGRPQRFTQIYTATDLFGERYGAKASAKFHAWLETRLPPAGPVSMDRKVYLTRSRLGAGAGRFCNEELLEEFLREDGYEIIAPETLPLAEQVAVFQDAGQLLFSESSALHLYALVQRAGQRVGVIQRRRDLPPLLTGQMRPGLLAGFHTINVIERVFWPPVRQDNRSIAVLDFDALRVALVQAGLLRETTPWRVPNADELRASLYDGLGIQEKLVPEEERAAWLRAFRKARQEKRASA